MTSFQFDAKNAEDYDRITLCITDALKKIAENPGEAATKANLAKVSGVHRNTLYKRALAGAKHGEVEQGWPFSELLTIVDSRKKVAPKDDEQPQSQTAEQKLESALLRLEKSRYVAGSWFHRSLQLKQERDEAVRQVECLLMQVEDQRRENELLRRMLKGQIGVVK